MESEPLMPSTCVPTMSSWAGASAVRIGTGRTLPELPIDTCSTSTPWVLSAGPWPSVFRAS